MVVARGLYLARHLFTLFRFIIFPHLFQTHLEYSFPEFLLFCLILTEAFENNLAEVWEVDQAFPEKSFAEKNNNVIVDEESNDDDEKCESRLGLS